MTPPTPSPSAPRICPATPDAIAEASALLAAGRLVAMPTETVYGLAALAGDGRAVASIFAAKGRPHFNPLIVHVDDVDAAEAVATLDERAERLAERFWPGPLTLVLPRRSGADVAALTTAGLDTVAVRVPAHPVARALLHAVRRPLAAPSANRSGHVSATTPQHVAADLGREVAMILAAGRAPIGLESTVLDLTGETPVLLRPGAVTVEELETLIGSITRPTGMDAAGDGRSGSQSPDRPRSPGQLSSHYAPTLPLRLNVLSALDGEALLCFGPEFGVSGGAERLNLSLSGDLAEAAANLFAHLRALDRPEFRAIAVMPIPERGLGAAIADRLRRAAHPRDPAPHDPAPHEADLRDAAPQAGPPAEP